MPRYALAVDIGGTKILVAMVSETGEIIARHRADTPERGVDAVLQVIAASAEAVRGQSGVRADEILGVGVGAPGPLDPRLGIVFEAPNLAGWRDVPLAELLASRLAMPVCIEHDATAAALAEWWIGAGRLVHDVVYVTVSTGVGGGIIMDDRVIHGVTGTAGEVGHMTIEIDGPRCHCGNRGCLEVLASGPAIARMAREAIASGRPSALLEMAGGNVDAISAATVEEAARAGDVVANDVFDRAGTYLGIAVANLINLLNPARVIIGGGVSKAGDLLFTPLRRTARERALERPARDAEIVSAVLGDDVGAIGAAAVAFQRAGYALRERRS